MTNEELYDRLTDDLDLTDEERWEIYLSEKDSEKDSEEDKH